jgi:hypothetical protein
MSARPIDEPHRVSSQLELLFDLTFVVAVAAITAQLAHRVADGHALAGIAPFLQVFFAIWWAWMNFTWFASSYDTDDVAYRLLTMLQMAGVLVLAAGAPAAADDSDYRAVTLGYFIMRIGLVAQWLRVGVEDRASRRTALRYAAGITIVQVGWILRLFLSDAGALRPSSQVPLFAILAVLELAVPRWAERARATNWHPHHIAERYGISVGLRPLRHLRGPDSPRRRPRGRSRADRTQSEGITSRSRLRRRHPGRGVPHLALGSARAHHRGARHPAHPGPRQCDPHPASATCRRADRSFRCGRRDRSRLRSTHRRHDHQTYRVAQPPPGPSSQRSTGTASPS